MEPEEQASLESRIRSLEARITRLSSLMEVSALINSTLDLEEVLGHVMEKAQSVMHAEASSVMLINPETDRLECKLALGEVGDQVAQVLHLEKGQGVAGWVWAQDQPLLVPDVARDPRFFRQIDQQSGFRTRSILAAPLRVKDRIIGVAEVINRTDGEQFDDLDQELFIAFCRHVALAIENARMHQMALQQSRMQQQLDSAKIIQQSFMPQVLPGGPEVNFELAARNLQATAVGGDFYDAMELDGGRVGLLIGDVSGKGVPAALYMARLMSDVRFLAQRSQDPGDLLCDLNEGLCERSRNGLFVTMQVLIIDVEHGTASLANAGHLPVLHCSPSRGQKRWLNNSLGIPLGILKGQPYDTLQLQLAPGDFLLLCTDGIVEARNAAGRSFGMPDIDETTASRGGATALLETIINQVMEHVQHVSQHDDITALVFHWKGSGQEKRAAKDD
ncbi:SpoIIE family protein phosphatase [bacterium]|nr:SpoIIE family protein phosphatase [bacterium]